jgi:hypothetical protein
MNVMQWMQEIGSAEMAVALLVLPWLSVALMQVLSLGTLDMLDDNFGARAGAALRWAEQNPDPAAPMKSAVLRYRVRSTPIVRDDIHEIAEDEAA